MTVASIKDTPAFKGQNRYGLKFIHLPPNRQAKVLLDVAGYNHLHRAKNNAATTKRDRAYILYQVIDQLREEGFKLTSLLNFDQRHLQAVLVRWKTEELSPATITKRISILRWFLAAIGKRGMLSDPLLLGLEPKDLRRTYVSRSDKSWSGRGTIPLEKIDEVRQFDDWVASQLDLMRLFGLRITEAILMKPRASHMGTALRVEEGTKGGRSRVVPIATEEQLKALEKAKELSMTSRKGAMVQPRKTPQQSRRRIYYVCEKFGITKAQLEITPHGLRHQYANDLYEEVSGTPSAVRGSSEILDRSRELAALHAVTSAMGHARLNITSAYTGPRKSLTQANQTSASPAHSPVPSPNAAQRHTEQHPTPRVIDF
jgi:integrase